MRGLYQSNLTITRDQVAGVNAPIVRSYTDVTAGQWANRIAVATVAGGLLYLAVRHIMND